MEKRRCFGVEVACSELKIEKCWWVLCLMTSPGNLVSHRKVLNHFLFPNFTGVFRFKVGDFTCTFSKTHSHISEKRSRTQYHFLLCVFVRCVMPVMMERTQICLIRGGFPVESQTSAVFILCQRDVKDI